ncbi:hypothetical protein IP86_06015 [Rhodopseudomonas sp. AAP120]|nr:hypothetical protein [Rhodopseudomonas sp. AAP120]KPG01018.1 hypothetical protein IP86_06015 [Rhodopseudomonas sp. AAP120]
MSGKAKPLKVASGDGTFDGMEARLAKVEAALEHVGREMADVKTDVRSLRDQARTDFRITFTAIIAVALGLAGLMAKGFHWL